MSLISRPERSDRQDDRREAARRPPRRAQACVERLVERHADELMRTARRYAVTPADAEDAYQRGIEIALTKAPSIPEAELLPWLKTVIKHEAFALRRLSERCALGVDTVTPEASDSEAGAPSLAPSPAEQAERFERLRVGAEAMRQLKPQELRAMTLLAEGYSYRQICEETGWTYTKVNRCLAEGRKRFLSLVNGIESGDECDRLLPQLESLTGDKLDSDELVALRRHLRRCLACRARLRESRIGPGLLVALLPGWRRWERMVERANEWALGVRVKASALLRHVGVGSPAADSVASAESRGLGGLGLTKGLALVCIGTASAGGLATQIAPLLDPLSEEKTEDRGVGPRGHVRAPSSDRRLVAERLREPSARSLEVAQVSSRREGRKPPEGPSPVVERPSEDAPGSGRPSPQPLRAQVQSNPEPVSSEPASSRDAPAATTPPPSHQPQRGSAAGDNPYGDGITNSQPYGDGIRPSDPSGHRVNTAEPYGDGVRRNPYGAGIAAARS